jgi:dipeptidyl-peptidase 4
MSTTSLNTLFRKLFIAALFTCLVHPAVAQFTEGTQWTDDGYGYFRVVGGEIVQSDLREASKQTVILGKADLTPAGATSPIRIVRFAFSDDRKKILLATNTRKVWRYDTRGDSWVYDIARKSLRKLGNGRPEASLMFAKFSPDATRVAYVSQNNIFVEDLASGAIKQLTTDGSSRLINGTFDWVYEEELDCRDGFRWSPDGSSIAYWQLDATKTRNYLMLNTTDSLYPFTVPVEYPVVGEDPSLCRIGVIPAAGGATTWMKIPGSPVQNYLPRMEWAGNAGELIIQQLNRRQNESRIFLVNARSGEAKNIYTDADKAWVDAKPGAVGWDWLNNGKNFVWLSEKDGWRHAYTVDRGGKEKRITNGNYDVKSISLIDQAHGLLYFTASPDNATQTYLFKTKLDGSGKAERVTPALQRGSHSYDISPNGLIAIHSASAARIAPVSDVIRLPSHEIIYTRSAPQQRFNAPDIEFFQVTTSEGITLDGWMIKPKNFDPARKYPIVFHVYGEPASQTVADRFGTGRNNLYIGDMANDGYIYASIDNRGTPSLKGREWRKAIYKNIGMVNIRDQALGAQAMFSKYPFIDTRRVAVWGWSGGGSTTLNLLFQYPEIYQTGISIAAVDNQLNYDNIYQERYMGLLPEDRDAFVKGSPLYHAKNLKGNLLLIHGTGDDNVHYNNAEQMINELVRHNKVFSLMAYPNRTHSISEGEGTSQHLANTYTTFLKQHCPPGAR